MASGKQQSGKKGGKKGKKKVIEAMTRKEWYDVVAPANFKTRQFAKTICNKTIGNNIAADNLRGRVYEANLGDLNQSNDRDEPYRKIKFCVQDVQGRNLLTQFHGMDLTMDRVRCMLKKWCTTIEATIDVKTKDGYEMRLFVIGFSTKNKNQVSKNCYANMRLVRAVRYRMTKIVKNRISQQDITKAVNDLTHDVISDLLFKRCNPLLPLRDVKIRKIKMLRTPRVDREELLKNHGEIPESKEGLVAEVEVAETA